MKLFRRPRRLYVFRARLDRLSGVKRRLAVRGDQTLADLHLALQSAFGWDDEHLYAFWLDGRYWSLDAPEYGRPGHAKQQNPGGTLWDLPETRAADQPLEALGLLPGQRIAYVFDFAHEWRVELTLADIAVDDGGRYPAVLEAVGDAPPQYADAA
jgi:hypothetical protein